MEIVQNFRIFITLFNNYLLRKKIIMHILKKMCIFYTHCAKAGRHQNKPAMKHSVCPA